MLLVCPHVGGKEDQETLIESPEARWLRLEEVESLRSEQGSVVREIRMLRSMWRGLETESRFGLRGHERGNPGYRQGHDLTDHRASPRPYRVIGRAENAANISYPQDVDTDALDGQLGFL